MDGRRTRTHLRLLVLSPQTLAGIVIPHQGDGTIPMDDITLNCAYPFQARSADSEFVLTTAWGLGCAKTRGRTKRGEHNFFGGAEDTSAQSAYPPRLSVNADIAPRRPCANSGHGLPCRAFRRRGGVTSVTGRLGQRPAQPGSAIAAISDFRAGDRRGELAPRARTLWAGQWLWRKQSPRPSKSD